MIRIEPDVLQIIVFASGANAFLGIGRPGVAAGNRAGVELVLEPRWRVRLGQRRVGRRPRGSGQRGENE